MRRRIVLILSVSILVMIVLVYSLWPRGGPSSPTADSEVYRAVFEHKALKPDAKQAIYLLVEGADPPENVLGTLRKRWPTLQPFSQLPKKGRGNWVWTVRDLKWLNADSAEVRASFSNGIDGWSMRYRVVKKNGKWQVEEASTEAVS